MNSETHYLRLRRGDVEFEIRGSAEMVAGAWAELSGQVSDAFTQQPTSSGGTFQGASDEPTPQKGSSAAEAVVEAKPKKPRPRPRRRSAPGNSSANDERARVAGIIANAPFDEFPDLGDKPSALYIGYAVLQWMRDEHGVDGLTAKEIQSVADGRLRRPNTSNAYQGAFRNQSRAVSDTGSPKVYRLMVPGERALEAFLRMVSDGATSDEASEAGDIAEVEAEEAAS